MKVRCIAALVLALSTGSLGANERLSMRVSPSVSFAPANLIVQTVVEANNSNRAIEIIAESPDFYRSTEVPLDGERSARTTRFELKSLPSGMYEVRAILKGTGGHELAYVQSRVNVVENGSVSR